MSHLFNLDRVLKLKDELNWDTVFIAIDLHDTIVFGKLNPHYQKGKFLYFNHAIDVLKFWTEASWIKLILFSSSSEKHINDFMIDIGKYGVKFDYVNKNPECTGGVKDTANFGDKFYYNVLLDDRAGFNGDEDWARIKLLFNIPFNDERSSHVKMDANKFNWDALKETDQISLDEEKSEILVLRNPNLFLHLKIPPQVVNLIHDIGT